MVFNCAFDNPLYLYLKKSPMQLSRITFNPDQCGGKPCIRGMRIRVTDVIELLATGITIEEIITEELPDLEFEDVVACLNYDATKLNHAELRVA